MIPISVTSIHEASQLAGTKATLSPSERDIKPRRQEESVLRNQVEQIVSEESPEESTRGLKEAVEKLQTTAHLVNKRLKFQIDEASDMVQVLIIDRQTEEVIREIPPSEALRLAERLEESLSLLIDRLA